MNQNKSVTKYFHTGVVAFCLLCVMQLAYTETDWADNIALMG